MDARGTTLILIIPSFLDLAPISVFAPISIFAPFNREVESRGSCGGSPESVLLRRSSRSTFSPSGIVFIMLRGIGRRNILVGSSSQRPMSNDSQFVDFDADTKDYNEREIQSPQHTYIKRRGCAKGILLPSSEDARKKVQFDENGCPVGMHSRKFVTKVGVLIKDKKQFPFWQQRYNDFPMSNFNELARITKKTSHRNKSNRSQQRVAHIAGRMSFAQRKAHMRGELGRSPQKRECWDYNHIKENKRGPNESTEEITGKIREMIEAGIVDQDQVFEEVLGHTKRGRVHGEGRTILSHYIAPSDDPAIQSQMEELRTENN